MDAVIGHHGRIALADIEEFQACRHYFFRASLRGMRDVDRWKKSTLCLYRIGIRGAWGASAAARISISAKKQHLYTILKKIISFAAAALPRKGGKVR
ncbi:hypothetical protein D3C72_2226130 [compost metagenome]